jgi:hypothetical protein
MNNTVRSYLIEVARKPNKFVSYSDVVRDCKLGYDLTTEYGRQQLSTTLGEVSVYEHGHKRPLVSALAIYSDTNKNDHGDGFYKLAESLGIGKFKILKEELYAFTEAEECRAFWQNDNIYTQFATITTSPNVATDFYTLEELDFFRDWHLKPYDKDNEAHYAAKEHLMDTVWEKTIQLCKSIAGELDGFGYEGKKIWHQRGWKETEEGNTQAAVFKPYTWVKVFRNTDRGRDIYFTFEINAVEEAFVYKIDCRNTRDSKLSQQQIELCKSLVPHGARWNEIPYTALLTMNWDALKQLCKDFIAKYINYYDAIVEAIWGSPLSPDIFKNTLIRRDRPTDGHSEFPDHERKFKGVDVDFNAQTKAQKDLGDAGETLVKEYEIRMLKEAGRHEDAAKVEIVKDGEGYDVMSFDSAGNLKYIEVKTTTGDRHNVFHLSDNEFEFMKRNVGKYCIYRVYNYDSTNNFGEFFEVSDNVEEQLLLKPSNYKVFIKSLEVILS